MYGTICASEYKNLFNLNDYKTLSLFNSIYLLIIIIIFNDNRTKLKQTEVDCEILRKCYEDLKDENRRLNKEIHDLKSLKKSQPFRVQLSAATLSMCPSCERTYGGAATDNSTKISFSIGDQKPHFYGIPSQIH